MSRYRYESYDMGEREPLDNPNNAYPQQQYQDQQTQQAHYSQEQPPPAPQQQTRTSPQRAGAGPGIRPGAHPDSTFNRLQANRRYSRDAPALAGGIAQAQQQQPPRDAVVSPVSPPQPPAHRDPDGRYWGQELGYPTAPQANTTPGADNFGETAGGGMAGLAYSVAERNARQSGMEAARGPSTSQPYHPYQSQQQPPAQPSQQPPPQQQPPPPNVPQQAYQSQQYSHQNPNLGQEPIRGRDYNPAYGAPAYPADRASQSSLAGLAAGANPHGQGSAGMRTPSRSPHSFANDLYTDDPYQGYTAGGNAHLGVVNPNEIDDDGDDGLEYGRRGPRTSMLSLGGGSNHRGNDAGAAAAGGAAAGGVMGTLGGLYGRGGQQYDPVHNGSTAYPGGGGNGSAYDLGAGPEKYPGPQKKRRSGRKWKLVVIFVIGFLIIAGVACGIVFGVVLKRGGGGGSGGGNDSSEGSAASDYAANGDLGINSPEIQSMLNNPNLHKVFPGIDYTPINTQYPACLTNPPDQNNVTRDVAVLSQLTNTIRLYGTDCNQTEMVLHAISQLQMENTVKVWMNAWIEANQTTNERQLAQMYDILNKYGDKNFVGVIIGNEVLFREQMTVTELSTLLTDVRANLTNMNINLPVATSDLGNNWTPELAEASDYVMANIHPFFAGVTAEVAAGWTWNFWETNNGAVFKSDATKNIIAETGWPSQGGTDCGSDTVTSCASGSVAGISEMNTYMSDWICQALTNGTQYFWFEAFDEPWKISFDTPGQEWEDHWGVMDVNRNLKSGVTIPDCGGKTVD